MNCLDREQSSDGNIVIHIARVFSTQFASVCIIKFGSA